MPHLKSYIVRIWRRGESADSALLGVVEELEERHPGHCETPEELLEVLQSRRVRQRRNRRTFGSFEELHRILGSS